MYRYEHAQNIAATLITTAMLGGPYLLQIAQRAYAQTIGGADALADVAPLGLDQVLGSGPLVGALVLMYLLAGKVQATIENLTRWKPQVEIVHRYPQKRRAAADEADEEITGVRHLRTEERERDS